MAKKVPVQKIPTALSGTAGEYFVAAQLSRLGHIASINLKNTKGVDILVMNEKATQTVMIQVKTNQGSDRTWMLTKKADTLFNDKLFYVFVNLNGPSALPDFFIVPSKVVAKYGLNDHLTWLKTPGKKGQPHKDNSIRIFRDEVMAYRDKWDTLGL
ncbi:MAG TPA: hypothetical protein PLB89_06910 [Flavobacteriales bacterium]|nr:hypothetical protein [Flavobacteriales bacterium]